ncbi:/ / hypothetical protein / 441570:443231 Reverse [Candidatus Hepatoplasma crinochetorum]|uniref:Uncharacterized protein n=1 Tax=Candidatus Hepatoplasma crinochetorum TaxID=295596 RepID=A0A0G7ZMW3_9MOLU|nr:/ / hypothetical protein / 441570:443231 Reverse [Candidatus Hepatoplasma crinochetorum]
MLIAFIFALFLSWIIYFFTTENDTNPNSEFLNQTNSYIYLEDDYKNPHEYLVVDYKDNNDILVEKTAESQNSFHPYYRDDKIEFTWFDRNGDSEVYFYNSEDNNINVNDNYNAIYEEQNSSINHEYIYKEDFNDNYYFIIDNLNGWGGSDSSNNGGLGDQSIQEVSIIKQSTNEQKIINIAELLNYQDDDWYYIDQNNDYYRTIMSSNDLFHFNSIDYYQQNIYVNSRTLGTFMSIKVLDDNGNILSNPSINWIYSGNYDTYYYLYPSDVDGDYSIIYDQNRDKYIANPDYDAQETYDYHAQNGGLQDKFINWEINGNYYASNDLESLRNIQNQEKDQLFMVEHCVKILNSYIEELGPENFFSDPNDYDPNDLYFSMFDNHAERGNTNLELQESLNKEEWYSHDLNSYMKILEVNPNNTISKTNLAPMTGRVLLNHQTRQKSPTISSLMFFNENNHNYVAVDQGNGQSDFADSPSFTIYQFDKIDTKIEDFTSYQIVFNYNDFDSKMIYRSYPIWKELNDNIFVSWNG